MSNPNHSDLASLRARIQDLTETIQSRAQQRRARGLVLRVAGIALIAASSIGLSRLTSLLRQIDAPAIAQISRQEIEQRLPGARAHAQGYLAAEAPRIVRDAFGSMLSSLPELRRVALRGFDDHIDTVNATFETRTKILLTQLVFDAKREIDAAFPEDTDRVKLEKLVKHVSEGFEETILLATSGLYPSYKSEMERITAYLRMLRSTPVESLTKTQQLHRGIIDTLLQILARHQVDHPPKPPR